MESFNDTARGCLKTLAHAAVLDIHEYLNQQDFNVRLKQTHNDCIILATLQLSLASKANGNSLLKCKIQEKGEFFKTLGIKKPQTVVFWSQSRTVFVGGHLIVSAYIVWNGAEGPKFC